MFKKFAARALTLTDAQYYEILVMVVFYSGFKAATVTAKQAVIKRHFPDYATVAAYTDVDIARILADETMIRHEGKVRGCVANARRFAALVNRYTSFKAYLDSFAPANTGNPAADSSSVSIDRLLPLIESLQLFAFLGNATVFHFMTDCGYRVLKPDRVLCRIFCRLGLISSEKKLVPAVLEGIKFANATGYPIRYIDIVLVAYGQVQSMEFGIDQGICLKIPRCGECRIANHCTYRGQRAG